MKVTKIVLTGGPGAGKSTIVRVFQEYLKSRGYNSLVVPETASILFNGGFARQTDPQKIFIFQKMAYDMQKFNEELYLNNLDLLNQDKDTIIIFDRGLVDNGAYLNFINFMKNLNIHDDNYFDIANRYDYIIGLSSASNLDYGYTTKNNPSRIENKDEAKQLDDITLNLWTLNDNFQIITSTKNFDDKINFALMQLNSILSGEFISLPRRYLINNYINEKDLLKDYTRVKTRTYLKKIAEFKYKIFTETSYAIYHKKYTVKDVTVYPNFEQISNYQEVNEQQFIELLSKEINLSFYDSTEYRRVIDGILYKIIKTNSEKQFLEITATKQNLCPTIPEFDDITPINNYIFNILTNQEGDTRTRKKIN